MKSVIFSLVWSCIPFYCQVVIAFVIFRVILTWFKIQNALFGFLLHFHTTLTQIELMLLLNKYIYIHFIYIYNSFFKMFLNLCRMIKWCYSALPPFLKSKSSWVCRVKVLGIVSVSSRPPRTLRYTKNPLPRTPYVRILNATDRLVRLTDGLCFRMSPQTWPSAASFWSSPCLCGRYRRCCPTPLWMR